MVVGGVVGFFEFRVGEFDGEGAVGVQEERGAGRERGVGLGGEGGVEGLGAGEEGWVEEGFGGAVGGVEGEKVLEDENGWGEDLGKGRFLSP